MKWIKNFALGSHSAYSTITHLGVSTDLVSTCIGVEFCSVSGVVVGNLRLQLVGQTGELVDDSVLRGTDTGIRTIEHRLERFLLPKHLQKAQQIIW